MTTFNAAVLGAAGGIGQPLSLLLKMNPLVKNLNLYDVVNTPGVAADLGHICTGAKVSGFVGDAQLRDALKDRDVVIIPAGVPRKPGMTRDDLFNVNAGIIKTLATACAEVCPKACFLIISNPVNSTVPIFAEVLKKAGVYNPKKLFGVTTLDLVRARTFVAEAKGADVTKVNVPVIGGHSGATIVPLLSQSGFEFSQDEIDKLTHRIQFGGDEVVKAKDGAGSATLSMAYAAVEFASDVLKALAGEEVVVCTYVDASAQGGKTAYFAHLVKLGKEGVAEILPVPSLSDHEKKLLETANAQLITNIESATTWFASK